MDGSLLKSKQMFYPALTFPYLAALTPPEHTISMTHELLEDINFNEKIDLVGLTSITNNVFRAYEIADEFRKRNIPVVIGGFHVSAEPEEALEHADSVFIGEAEDTWPQFLRDFQKGTCKRKYKADIPPSLKGIPVPDYSIINKAFYTGYERKGLSRYFLKPVIPIQTARGCTNNCDFCDVCFFHNYTYRPRPVSEVIEEIKKLEGKWVCFVDDNIYADYSRAKELLQALIPLKIIWFGQGTISAAEDKELLSLSKKSGCRGLLIGLETIFQKGLTSLNKNINKVEQFEENLKAYKKAGIEVDASMIFGLDEEDQGVFQETYDFLRRNHVPFAGLQPLRPSPGTTLYKRLKKQGRLKENKWWLDPGSAADVFNLKYTGTKTGEKFPEKLFEFYQKFYSTKSIIQRFLIPPQPRFLLNMIITLRMRKKITRQAFISEY